MIKTYLFSFTKIKKINYKKNTVLEDKQRVKIEIYLRLYIINYLIFDAMQHVIQIKYYQVFYNIIHLQE